MIRNRYSIAHVGPYPPPYGGVSVHIRRLHRRLKHSGIDSTVYCDPLWQGIREDGVTPLKSVTGRPLCYLGWMSEPALHIDADIIHWHHDWHTFALTLLFMLRRRKKVVITVHNQKDEELWANTLFPMRLASNVLLKDKRVRWVAVSEAIKNQLLRRGVNKNAIAVIPAYIPPLLSGHISKRLPETLETFLLSHTPILSVYGTRFQFNNDGVDLYGFDLCIELVQLLQSRFTRLGLVVCVPQIHDVCYYKELKDRVSKHGTASNIFFVTEPLEEAYPLWQASDIYLRPTSTDGDAIAVREALSLHVPVVASDVSPRPEGTVVFSNRNIKDFSEKVIDVLNNKEKYVNKLKQNLINDNYTELVEVYSSLINSVGHEI